jgi:sugar/nucleoside kinase (ribokinase family)
VTVGDVVLDVVVEREAQLVHGSDTPGRLVFRVGGSAANAARAFVTLGGEAVFIGSVGDDGAGRALATALRRAGVTTHVAVHARLRTARLLLSLAADGERTFVTERGAADLLEPGDLDDAWFRRASALHLPLYSLTSEPLGAAARRAVGFVRSGTVAAARPGPAAIVSVDLASVGPIRAIGARAAAALVEAVAPDVLFANAAEAAVFGVRSSPKRLLGLAPVVVVKQGEAGCEVLMRGPADGAPHRFTVATRPLVVSDTTGAGDAFDAGFLSVVSGMGAPVTELTASHLRRAAVAANRAAATAITSRRVELDW